MENKGFESDNIPADLGKSWHIPRPTLARNSKGSHGSTSSNNSTQSARSGSLLLTAANLAQIENQESKDDVNLTRQQNLQYYLQHTNGLISLPGIDLKKPDPDAVSVASSMHFTVVNMNARPTVRQRSFCRKHQLTILVLSMSALFTIGIMTAIFLLEMRARRQQY